MNQVCTFDMHQFNEASYERNVGSERTLVLDRATWNLVLSFDTQ